MNRRFFLRDSALSVAGITIALNGFFKEYTKEKFSVVKFGICADLRHDIIYDAPQRLDAFINAMQQKQPDFYYSTW